jgi:hypothetical protein
VGRCRGSAGRDPRGEVDSNEEECEEDQRDEDGLDVDRDFFFRLRSSEVIRTISRSKLSKASRVSASANTLATLVGFCVPIPTRVVTNCPGTAKRKPSIKAISENLTVP